MSNEFARGVGESERGLEKIVAELFDREDPENGWSDASPHSAECQSGFRKVTVYQKEQLEVFKKVFSSFSIWRRRKQLCDHHTHM